MYLRRLHYQSPIFTYPSFSYRSLIFSSYFSLIATPSEYRTVKVLSKMVNWDAATDRKLLLLALKVPPPLQPSHRVFRSCASTPTNPYAKQLNGPLDYARLKDEFDHNVTENTLRIRMHLLRKADGLGSPSKVKGARVAKGTYSSPRMSLGGCRLGVDCV